MLTRTHSKHFTGTLMWNAYCRPTESISHHMWNAYCRPKISISHYMWNTYCGPTVSISHYMWNVYCGPAVSISHYMGNAYCGPTVSISHYSTSCVPVKCLLWVRVSIPPAYCTLIITVLWSFHNYDSWIWHRQHYQMMLWLWDNVLVRMPSSSMWPLLGGTKTIFWLYMKQLYVLPELEL